MTRCAPAFPAEGWAKGLAVVLAASAIGRAFSGIAGGLEMAAFVAEWVVSLLLLRRASAIGGATLLIFSNAMLAAVASLLPAWELPRAFLGVPAAASDRWPWCAGLLGWATVMGALMVIRRTERPVFDGTLRGERRDAAGATS